MNALRRVGCFWLAMMAGFAMASAEDVAKMPKPTAYVDDYAGVMSAEGKAQVEAICIEVHEKTKAQIFFVTIKSLDGNTIESFANDLFHNWKIGEKKTDRGILLLLAVKEHKRRLEVGYGLEGILPDAKAGDIGRDMVPALKTSDYDAAAVVGVKEVAAVIAADSKVTLDTLGAADAQDMRSEAPPAAAPMPSSSVSGKFILALLPFGFFLLLFGFIVIIAVRRSRRMIGGGPGYYGGSSDSSSSFSSDSSSSSDSFSGGDGGDSGGGGASGDW